MDGPFRLVLTHANEEGYQSRTFFGRQNPGAGGGMKGTVGPTLQ